MPSQPPSRRAHPVFGIVCLLVYLCFATPLMPVATAITAWLDGEHHVAVTLEKGATRVVLSHDSASPRTAITHTHCIVSRAIVSIAEQDEPFHPDHVLNFSGSDVARNCSTATRNFPPSLSILFTAAAQLSLDAWRIDPATPAATFARTPTPALSVAVARATVFLI